jgi:hypothetical protein
MHRSVAIILACFVWLSLPATRAGAEPDARRAQIQAAETDALESLRRDVLAARLGTDLTVGDFLDRTDRHDSLGDVLKSATQIGGTRWIDDQTCIIRFELSGRRVADALVDLAKSLGEKSPVPADAVARQVETWARRTFSATGTSTGPQFLLDVRPADANPAWRAVPEADSREAVSAARNDAARRLLDSLGGIRLGPRKTVADALEVASVRAALQEWLGRQPVVGLEFGDDLEVRMTIAAPAEDLWRVFRGALAAQTEIPAPATDAEWNRLHDDVQQRVARAVGRSYVAATSRPPTTGAAAVPVPARAPEWVYAAIDAEGIAAGPARSLKTARLAEDDAARRLREQLYALPFSPDLTVGEAAKKDPRIEEAVSRSLNRARTYRVQWRDDGVGVRMTLDPRELWDELRTGR